MRLLAILALTVVACLPAFAADTDDAPKKGGVPGTNVDMPYLMAPLNNADGKLIGYAYISSRLTAATDTFALTVRDKLPFIQDAFVRDVYANSVGTPGDPQKVDIAGMEARLLADAGRVIGAAKVKSITVCTVQVSELRQNKTAPNVSQEDMPGAPPPKNPTKSRCAN